MEFNRKDFLVSWKTRVDKEVEIIDKNFDELNIEKQQIKVQIGVYQDPSIKDSFQDEIDKMITHEKEIIEQMAILQSESQKQYSLSEIIQRKINKIG